MIYIRVDANEEIATGHVMRCLSIADALKNEGEDSVFITADDCPSRMIEKRGYKTICLNSRWNDLNLETDKMLELVHERKVKKLLIDSYYVTEKYLRKLTLVTKTYYIDDLNRFAYPVNMLINYSINAKQSNYVDKYRGKGLDTEFFLGCGYAPLRKQFKDVHYVIREEMKNILITMGGADKENYAELLYKNIRTDTEFNAVKIHIIAGAFNKNIRNLENNLSNDKNLYIYNNISDMAEVMKICDVAISAGGTTLYELCACQVPTIAVVSADNQINNVDGFEKSGLLVNAGDIRKESVTKGVLDELKLMRDKECRRKFSLRMKEFNVGRGSEKIAKIIKTP